MNLDRLEAVFQPVDETVFPYAFDRQRAGLFEPFNVTLKATLQYLEVFVLPKLRANLSAPRET